MTTHSPMPVAGYSAQSQSNVDLANEGKELEERYLRWLDKIAGIRRPDDASKPEADQRAQFDGRALALAKTNIQQGAMWAIRAIFQPARIKLPDDTP